ncbi:hypothetical protein [Halobacillus sp. Marseille-Q1614]|uniref:hypothetical protein n=1 Tax=Halobacillus sp. Marseille-Q1614 TaxID=2709134 RepID=UPI00156F52EA|nr:hypothetical protein [Halobacillus sp. Marseille-Q1614]
MFKRLKELWYKLNPLYFPLFTAVPAGIWLIFSNPPWTSTYLSLYLLLIGFLTFSGAVEISDEELKPQLLGGLYMMLALTMAVIGLIRWLF